MLIVSGMNFSVREELILLTMIFVFCAFTVPIIIYSSHVYKQPTTSPIKVDASPFPIPKSAGYRGRMLINSVRLIEGYNRIRSENSTPISIYDIINVMKPYEMQKLYWNISKLKITPTESIWGRFTFVNKTLLTSRTTEIPLKVDW
jgi:hypothetical protein